ncbi:hypothetical protein SODALDRAFT_286059 [Sodiomyces alkalinus F11]|uniref:Uncharacterized protein n=1 Tax=Sodiomyces alkalinus (strain CBS 110278 / VKM F-3762 / F11) TaxID=1314773 RepID=A0A3N2PJT0_SODAK|nr:hypothetical protein SODALDRAFT_286539 [Sodiomyces alkalinus F11]XP_028462587.1 hypothetical protein SODALDRAFT_286059 [Sodiomyces alkalinus F11]ROT34455.1 hypothetical protein SODALDRAFT_286539 [Sodiomyces alkalinus F11]ROT34781.1 hypothetical protein SODALDRAFT_286059 [Sodiomyces alkalinus F11]
MRINEVFLALTPVVFANPVIRAEESQEVHITLELSKVAAQAAITVWNSDQTEVLAKSCSDSLSSGPFADHPIVFNVNSEHGGGDLTVGATSYTIGGGDAANALDCGRIASETELAINCVVSVPQNLGLRSLNKRSLRECFPDGPLEVSESMDVFEGKVEAGVPTEFEIPELNQTEIDEIVKRENLHGGLEKRQRGCAVYAEVRRVGNGNPHQNPWHIQLGEPMQCPSHVGCSTYHTTSRSFSIGWQANAGVEWINGGFSVVKTAETGNSYVCNGNANDFFAVWKNQGTTAYTVRNGIFSVCSGNWAASSNNIIIWSPNSQNRRGYYYCVYGRQYVRSIGDRWLDTAPHTPGGP